MGINANRKSSKTRASFRKRVHELLAPGGDLAVYKALALCQHGRELSLLEAQMAPYFGLRSFRKHFEKGSAMNKSKQAMIAQINATVESLEEQIIATFKEALRQNDPRTILQIGLATDLFKPDSPAYDHQRMNLLSFKVMLLSGAKPMTIKEIAKFVGREKESADGFSSLRRQCKELQIPIVPSRNISRKKS